MICAEIQSAWSGNLIPNCKLCYSMKLAKRISKEASSSRIDVRQAECMQKSGKNLVMETDTFI